MLRKIKVWQILTGLFVVLAAMGSFYTIDDRYAKASDLKNSKKEIEAKTVQTFEVFQMKQMVINDSMKLQLLNIQYDNLTDRYYKLRKQLKANPNDTDLKEEFAEVKRQRISIKEKRIKLLEKKREN